MSYSEALRKNYQLFSRVLEGNVCRGLYAARVISLNSMDKVLATNAQNGLTSANEELWGILLHCTEDQLEKMVEVLEGDENQKYKDLVETLRRDSGYTKTAAAKSCVTEEELSDQVALEELSQLISQEYSTLGLQLGLDYDTLKQIECNHPRNCEERNMAMFMKWWKGRPDRDSKISKLVKALGKAGRNDLAGRIRKMFSN